MGTGAPVNATFFLQVVGKRDDRAFAFANQPAAAGYAVPSSGSWNPAGSTRVVRDAVGLYRVVFAGLGGRLPAGVGGHVQVNGVGGNRTYCKVQSWGGAPDLTVSVGCFTPAGAPADAKFSAVFTSPAAHLAYVWADSPVTAEYHAYSVYSSNPVGGAMTIYHYVTGRYRISWTGVGAEIRDYGNAQVTAYGEDGAQCQILGIDSEYVEVQCYAANGVPMDALYAVLLAS
jgi:hypothetical protein